MKRSFALLPAIAILLSLLVLPAGAAYSAEPPQAVSEAYVVMDASTGQILIEKNMDQKEYPASITKIMTAILALENASLDDTHEMTYEATHSIDYNSTHIALTEGEVVTLRELMYAMLLTSANDAANGIAEMIGGTIPDFVEMMNAKAEELGCTGTHFANPHGLDDEAHYTTAHDMALITRYALTLPEFREFFSREKYTMGPTNKQPNERYFWSQHEMLFDSDYTYPRATGGKLGWTPIAKHTAVTTAEQDGLELICVVMNSTAAKEKYEDTAALFDYCFDSFAEIVLTKQSLQGFEVPLLDDGGQQVGEVRIYPDNEVDVLVHRSYEKSDLKLEYNVPEAYHTGEEIHPTLTVTMKKESAAMAPLSRVYDLIFEQEDYDEETILSMRVKEPSPFWGAFFRVLLWILAGAAGLILLLFLVMVVIRFINLSRRRRRQKRRNRRLYR
ncbi:MAG: D-alanyl-D-alanine carboxypeptidase [Oscillospiraceae bacterium]|nr:D-alanyl-D-alanine carboxypeptidase [Oscillospiraceae bacterium]